MGYLQNYIKKDNREYCDNCDQLIDTEKEGDFLYDETSKNPAGGMWICVECSKKKKALPKTVSQKHLGFNADSKTSKGNKQNKFFTSILYLAPDYEADSKKSVCPWSSAGCRESCLYTAGLGGVYPSVPKARIKKTKLFHNNKTEFFNLFHSDIEKFEAFCKKHNVKPTVRDDGTSDLGLSIMTSKKHPSVQFYNYTKSAKRYYKFLNGRFNSNVHFTFSRSEENEADAFDILEAGGQVAVVFRKDIPKKWKGYTVVNGDLTDLRFTDRKVFNIPTGQGFVVGLKAKGKAKKDTSGFVVDL